jgi:GST-like protein
VPYAVERYSNEVQRLATVVDGRLKGRDYLVGDYSIADIATFPWLRSWERQGIEWADYPALKDWFDRIDARPAVQRGVQVLTDLRKELTDDKARHLLFGAGQFEKR